MVAIEILRETMDSSRERERDEGNLERDDRHLEKDDRNLETEKDRERERPPCHVGEGRCSGGERAKDQESPSTIAKMPITAHRKEKYTKYIAKDTDS